jgi:predicted SAM-dependent methyltransferase
MKPLALWRLDRELRRLQRSYLRGETTAIPEYLATLARARALWLKGTPPRKRCVHLGAGGHHLEDWINVDVLPAGVDVLADFLQPLPFRSGSVDLLHSEDLLEHLDVDAGKQFLRECHRILRPGGVMRVLTPDLRALVQAIYIDRAHEHLAWCRQLLAANGPCEALNMHLRMNGEHRFVYDGEHLTGVLEAIGFRVRLVRYNWSPVRELRYLDLRDFGLNLFLEAEKANA